LVHNTAPRGIGLPHDGQPAAAAPGADDRASAGAGGGTGGGAIAGAGAMAGAPTGRGTMIRVEHAGQAISMPP
jgi:hypothetical protein